MNRPGQRGTWRASNLRQQPLRRFTRDFATFAGPAAFKAVALILLGAIVESAGLLLLIPLFSLIIDAEASSWIQRAAAWLFSLFSAESRHSKLALVLALFAAVVLVRAWIIVARDVTTSELEIGFVQGIRSRITRRLASARWDVVSRLRHSRIHHIMGAGLQQVDGAIYTLLRIAVSSITLTSHVVLASVLSPRLAAVALGSVLISVVALLPLLRRARQIGVFVHDVNLSLLDNVGQFLGALKLAVSQNLQHSFTREFHATLAALRREQVRYVRQQAVTRVAVASFSGAVGALIIGLGLLVFDLPSSVLITVLLVFSRMNAPAMQLHFDAQHLARALPVYERVLELEHDLIAAQQTTHGGPTLLEPARHLIIFDRVTFTHDADRPSPEPGGVRELSVVIGPGITVGVTGPSGAGKTTFADLLVGLYPPQSGTVRIGDVPLAGSALAAWRTSISYVAQDPFLFHDTIRRNLLWTCPDAQESGLWHALRIAGAEDLVRRAEHGLDAVVGERGTLLSGGERQRLAIARAVLRKPHLFVLDEATSAIDVEGEAQIFRRLVQLQPRPTVVIIAHRAESLAPCDRIIRFDAGRIVSDTCPSLPGTGA